MMSGQSKRNRSVAQACERLVRARGPWVLVEAFPPVEKSESGILYPSTAPLKGRKYAIGKVLSVGDGWTGGRHVHRMDELAGKHVLYSGIIEEVDTSKGHQYLLGERRYFVRATDIMLFWTPGEADESVIDLGRW